MYPVIHLWQIKLKGFLVMLPQNDVSQVLSPFPNLILVTSQTMVDLINLLRDLELMIHIIMQL